MDLKRRVRGIAITLLILPLIVSVLFLGIRTIQQTKIKRATVITGSQGIDFVEEVELGGVSQWIMVRGEDVSKPVLLWVHGGPGNTSLPVARAHDSDLVKEFVVVHWDQRGAGKSFSPELLEDDMTVERFVADIHEITTYLLDELEKEKVILLGHSWGSKIGILAVSERPELYYGYIGVSQSVNTLQSDIVGYEFALERARLEDNERAMQELLEIGGPPWSDQSDRSIYARWVNSFGGTGRAFTIQDYFIETINSPDYSIGDVFSFFRGLQFSGEALGGTGRTEAVDLFEQVARVEVPVIFLQGRFDFNTPGEVVQRYASGLQGPSIDIVWFDESAHFPQYEETEEFVEEIVNFADQLK